MVYLKKMPFKLVCSDFHASPPLSFVCRKIVPHLQAYCKPPPPPPGATTYANLCLLLDLLLKNQSMSENTGRTGSSMSVLIPQDVL